MGKGVHRPENIGRVKWDELRRDGDEVLEEDVIPKAPLWKRALKLLKILLPHVGLNVLLLSYIAMGAIMFIWLEADHELQSRKEKLQKIYTMYDKIINESTTMCSGTVYNSSQVDLRLRPLLRILSRTHEYDDRFTESGQLWNDIEDNMTTRSYAKLLQFWHFVASIVELMRTNMFNGDVDSIDSLQLKKKRRESDEETSEDDEDRLQLPIASYFALIIGNKTELKKIVYNFFRMLPKENRV
ncbi:hypothetical protein ANCCEY_05787 [Ancylostoma ceylanicum]|uniref:Uncharacterized protein n=1 Tax=Ancylostoma ceylanicum TaxID=53326 RepID=A0A0D6LVA6_9BILA|nr:hypothetical protein ANCCEY_05787 [Ancylostoma ceylanicum]